LLGGMTWKGDRETKNFRRLRDEFMHKREKERGERDTDAIPRLEEFCTKSGLGVGKSSTEWFVLDPRDNRLREDWV